MKSQLVFITHSVWMCLVFLFAACQGNPPESKETLLTPTPAAVKEFASPTAERDKTPTVLPRGLSDEPLIPIPDRENYQWRLVAQGFEQPTVLAHAGDGSKRLFIAEKNGRIHIIENGWVKVEPFLDIRNQVFTEGDAGLLGLVFDPGFEENGYFYLNYVNIQGNSVIARFEVSPDDPDQAASISEHVILEVEEAQAGNYAGTLGFGPDGYLYIAVGDGGSENAELENNPAQDANSLLGKILRIDVNDGLPYSNPEGNLYVGKEGRDEIWALGLRNPWGFAFDDQTGELFVADPGHTAFEEINYLPGVNYHRRNFSWNYLEGREEYLGPLPSGGNYVFPIHQYAHVDGFCKVIGGEVYRGASMPEWGGIYIFGDHCQGDMWALVRNMDDSWTLEGLYRLGYPITAFGMDEAGEIYVLGFTGEVSVLVPVE